MAIDLRGLNTATADDLAAVDGGYVSPARYAVHKVEDERRTVIAVELTARRTDRGWRPLRISAGSH